MVDFSVVLLTFNSSKEQIEKTLFSIVNQKDVSVEILVCDDASRENHFDFIEDYLLGKGVSKEHVVLLGSEKNRGTVRNILKGLRKVNAKYAKLIGAGDLLYHEYTLRDVRAFMEKHQSNVCFGLLHGYRDKDGQLEFREQCSPRDIEAYRQRDISRIQRNLMLCEDWVSGASIFAAKEYYLKYISMLEDRVLYCEDWATGLSALDNIYPDFYDDYVVWYEVGDGISTSANSKFKQLIKKDNDEFWKLFDETAERKKSKVVNKLVSKRRRKKKADSWSMPLQLLYKALINPEMVTYEFAVRNQQKNGAFIPKQVEKGFLDERS